MIIDSHAHYAHAWFDREFPFLCEKEGAWDVHRGDRETLFAEMERSGIVGAIEPSIGFDAIEGQCGLVAAHRGYLWAAVGVHPTRCIHTAWSKRKKLARYAEQKEIIAIGETGLDYHHPRKKQYRLRQMRWFCYQLRLADRLNLPLILHIRAADGHALSILKRYKKRLHGGVVHCFTGDYSLAKQYLSLGFALGIGAKLLCDDAQGRALCDAVRQVPLSCLLAETDAPFVLPDVSDLSCSSHQRKKLCNSSMILPAVIRKIATVRGEAYETVEAALFENTVRVFHLAFTNDGE